MKVQGYKIPAFINNELSSVQGALLYGEDVGLTREYQADILKKLEVNDFDCVRLSVADIEQDLYSILSESQYQSLLGERNSRVVRVDDISSKCAEALQTFLNSDSKGFLLAVSGNLPTSNSIRKIFEGAKNAVALPCYPDDDRSIRQLVSDTMRQHNIRINPDALRWVQGNMGADRLMTRMELEKLILYAGEQKTLDIDDVRQSLVDSSDHRVDDVVYAVANGNVKALENGLGVLLSEGVSGVKILRMMQSHFINLHRASIDLQAGMPMDKVTKFVFWKHKKAFTAQLQNWQQSALTRALCVLAEAEKKCKQTGSVEYMVLSRACYNIIGLRGRR